jgi:hypothetical protein
MQRHGAEVVGGGLFAAALQSQDYRSTVCRAFGILQEAPIDPRRSIFGWWAGKTFLSLRYGCLYRQMMTGDIGPDIGYAGVCISPYEAPWNVVRSVADLLEQTDYVGPVRLDLSEDGAVVGLSVGLEPWIAVLPELSPRLWPPTPWARGWAVAIAATLPVGARVTVTTTPENITHLWLRNAAASPEGLQFAGHGLDATANGNTSREARRRATRTLARLGCPSLQYRTDIGKGLVGESGRPGPVYAPASSPTTLVAPAEVRV